jgi:copper chaperone CopZ
MTRLELPVRGLHCSGCERSLEAAVRRLDGVVSAKANRAAERLVVEIQGSRPVAPRCSRGWPGTEMHPNRNGDLLLKW